MSLTTKAMTALIAATALTLAACSSTSEPVESTPATQDPAPATTEAPELPDATTTVVEIGGFFITPASTELAAGTHTFEVANVGPGSHDVVIEGEGIETVATPLLSTGESASLTVDLPAGEYVLWCSVGNHRANGMEITITVS